MGIDRRLSLVLYVGMTRKLRIEYSGAMYHGMSRGEAGMPWLQSTYTI